jgi:hypothetical protein
MLLFQHFTTSNPRPDKQSVLVSFLIEKWSDPIFISLSRAFVMNHWSNYRIQQQTANQNAAFVGERGKYKIPGLACRPTIIPWACTRAILPYIRSNEHYELKLKAGLHYQSFCDHSSTNFAKLNSKFWRICKKCFRELIQSQTMSQFPQKVHLTNPSKRRI